MYKGMPRLSCTIMVDHNVLVPSWCLGIYASWCGIGMRAFIRAVHACVPADIQPLLPHQEKMWSQAELVGMHMPGKAVSRHTSLTRISPSKSPHIVTAQACHLQIVQHLQSTQLQHHEAISKAA